MTTFYLQTYLGCKHTAKGHSSAEADTEAHGDDFVIGAKVDGNEGQPDNAGGVHGEGNVLRLIEISRNVTGLEEKEKHKQKTSLFILGAVIRFCLTWGINNKRTKSAVENRRTLDVPLFAPGRVCSTLTVCRKRMAAGYQQSNTDFKTNLVESNFQSNFPAGKKVVEHPNSFSHSVLLSSLTYKNLQ